MEATELVVQSCSTCKEHQRSVVQFRNCVLKTLRGEFFCDRESLRILRTNLVIADINMHLYSEAQSGVT